MNIKKVGSWIVLAALLVNSPRFIQILLKVDGLSLGEWEAPLIGSTGIATGIVLSGGQMYIAHALPKLPKGIWFGLIVLGWLSMLIFSVVMIAPFLVAGIAQQPDLASVLDVRARWIWAIVAVTSVEIIAACTMMAQAILPNEEVVNKDGQPTFSGQNALPNDEPKALDRPRRTHHYRRGLRDTAQSRRLATTDQNTMPMLDSEKVARQSNLLSYYLTNPKASQRAVAGELGMSKSTVALYLSELEKGGAVKRSSDGVQVVISPSKWGK